MSKVQNNPIPSSVRNQGSMLNKLLIKSLFLITISIILVLWGDDFAEHFWGNHQNAITSVATVIAAIMAIMATFFVVVEIIRFERNTKMQRTYDLLSKYYDPAYFEYTFDAVFFIVSDLYPYQKEERVFNSKHPEFLQTRKKCSLLFNYYEDISQMYNMGLLDKDVFKRALGHQLPRLYEASEELLIEWRKQASEDLLFCEWKECAIELGAKIKEVASEN